jgi:hypothetical protein
MFFGRPKSEFRSSEFLLLMLLLGRTLISRDSFSSIVGSDLDLVYCVKAETKKGSLKTHSDMALKS